MNVAWTKCQGDAWCPLNTVSLDHKHFDGLEGVFIIWHGGTTPSTVLVDHGPIRDRLKFERTDAEVQKFAGLGLFVTWAAVPSDQFAGVQRFLTSRLSPKVARPAVIAADIPINLPW
jgi:hypothetical protein